MLPQGNGPRPQHFKGRHFNQNSNGGSLMLVTRWSSRVNELGKAAYMAYCQASDNKSLVSGAELPTWEDQKPEIREAWRAAADAVYMLCANDHET